MAFFAAGPFVAFSEYMNFKQADILGSVDNT